MTARQHARSWRRRIRTARQVICYMDRLERGAEQTDLIVDLGKPTDTDLRLLEDAIAYRRALAAEASAEAESFERLLAVLRSRVATSTGGGPSGG